MKEQPSRKEELTNVVVEAVEAVELKKRSKKCTW